MLEWLKNFFTNPDVEPQPELKTIIDPDKIPGLYRELKFSLLDQFHDYFQISFTDYENGVKVDIYGNHKSIGMKEFLKVIDANGMITEDIIINATDTGIQLTLTCFLKS